LVNPALGTKRYENDDPLRSYLSLGTLASALLNTSFLKRLAGRWNQNDLIPDSEINFPVFDIRVLNLALKPAGRSIKKYLAEFLSRFKRGPLMICMTATSAQLDEAAALARAAAGLAPAATRIIGGAHVTVAAEDCLKRTEFQVACIGEGVETLVELALWRLYSDACDFSTIDGIAFKDEQGRIIRNPLRTPIMPLDDYPFPSDSLDLFFEDPGDRDKNKNRLIYILSGYGCPYDCIFCAQRSIHHNKIRERSAENIFAEIKKLYTRGFRKFAFVQETFLNHKKRVGSLCRLIEGAGMQIEWTAEAGADQLAYGQLRQMQSAGLRFLQIGVESGDPALLKKIGKRSDPDQIRRVISWCRELKINTAFYLLVGLPGQGWQSIWRSALFIMDHPPYNRITRHASVSIAVPYPGTKIWQEQTVRLIDSPKVQMSWPERNPAVSVNEAGEFVGKNYTETDDLTAEEILEAWIYLDDFCHFLLHAVNFDPHDANSSSPAKSLEYAARMSYMIQRRTIRDLIVRAHSIVAAEIRNAAYAEIVQMDGGVEKHFKDITAATEPAIDVLMRFLAAAQFLNGFSTMKWLSVDNRIKWMKICAMIWHVEGRKINAFQFAADNHKTGLAMDRRLQTLDESRLNRCLVKMDAGGVPEGFEELGRTDSHIAAFGFIFSPVSGRLFEVGLLANVA